MDAASLRPLTSSLSEGVVIFDADGLTLDLNRAFSDLVGFNIAEGPLRPPYPWWPTAEEDPEVREELEQLNLRTCAGEDLTFETTYYDKNRKPVPVSLTAGPIGDGHAVGATRFEVVSSLKAARNARARRAAAAEVSKDLASIDDLDTLLGAAEHGFSLLFDGGSTIQVGVGEKARWFSSGAPLMAENLTAEVAAGLGGEPSPDTTSLRPGILLAPQSSVEGCRAWIQFTPPRRISADEMIVADLFAQAFAMAVDRLVQAERAADRETQLQRAVESHRLIGEAVGILVERHRCLPSEAFARLRLASQNRNVKLRDVAAQVIETGLDPEDA
ncbi:MAG: ANTAR domain-containing protein [Propionibacteriaceae bacterium]|nr:ANTAR domain-containing protein [Propionibacteriaceae bacterium]